MEYKSTSKHIAIVSGPIKISSEHVNMIKKGPSNPSNTFNGYFKSLDTQGRSR